MLITPSSVPPPEGGVVQEKVVEIERRSQRKAFLGGYRHRLTGAEYHHAAVQTLPKKRPDRGSEVTSRDTQVGDAWRPGGVLQTIGAFTADESGASEKKQRFSMSS